MPKADDGWCGGRRLASPDPLSRTSGERDFQGDLVGLINVIQLPSTQVFSWQSGGGLICLEGGGPSLFQAGQVYVFKKIFSYY